MRKMIMMAIAGLIWKKVQASMAKRATAGAAARANTRVPRRV